MPHTPPNMQTPDAEQPVTAIPAPITNSIDQLLQAIAQHQRVQSIDLPQTQTATTTNFAEHVLESTDRTSFHGGAVNEASPPEHLAALIDMINRLHDSTREEAAARQLAHDLATHLSATSSIDVVVTIATVDEASLRCNVVAASDIKQVDPRCEYVMSRQSVAQETISRSAVAVWPCHQPEKRHALLTLQQLVEQETAEFAVAVPLSAEGALPDAVVVCSGTWDAKGPTANPMTGSNTAAPSSTPVAERIAFDIARFLSASAPHLAVALKIRNQLDRTWWQKLARKAKNVCRARRNQLLAAIIAISAGVLMIPMDYKVTCQVELQPILRRFVASPFAAQLKTCLVEPGDVVEQGQLLAVLEGREIQWELSGVLSDLEKAKKERNAYLSERSFGLAAIARHQAQRMQNQASLLQERLSQLEIRSPIAGVIVSGDLKDTEGAPLEMGQALFEVAPLDRMKVHIGVPEDDIRHVKNQMLTSVQLDAMPSESLTATVSSIRPTAEIFEDDNVFIAEAEMDNSERLLRPGMRGQAKVSTGKQPLGWNLFHKPTAWLVGWLRW